MRKAKIVEVKDPVLLKRTYVNKIAKVGLEKFKFTWKLHGSNPWVGWGHKYVNFFLHMYILENNLFLNIHQTTKNQIPNIVQIQVIKSINPSGTDPEVYYYTSGTLNGLHRMIGTVNRMLNGLHGTIGTVNGTLYSLHGTVQMENGTRTERFD